MRRFVGMGRKVVFGCAVMLATLAPRAIAFADDAAPVAVPNETRKAPSDVPVAQEPATKSEANQGHLPEGVFVPVGVNIGAVEHRGKDGIVVGAEGSVVLFPIGHGAWTGAYADALYDSANERVRSSLGVEFGAMILGFDAGLFTEVGGERVRFGGEVRPMLSLGLVHVYGRWGWVFSGEPDGRFREIGVLLKVPFQVHDAKRARVTSK